MTSARDMRTEDEGKLVEQLAYVNTDGEGFPLPAYQKVMFFISTT
jgi:hypothetical protein